MVGGSVEDEHRYGRGRFALNVEGAFDWSDRGNLVREFAADAIGHHAAVGNSSDEYALAVYGVVGFEFVDEGAEESDIVNVVLHGVGAAAAGIPRGQAAGAAGVNDDEILAFRSLRHF